MSELYRYRSIDAIIKYKELEESYFYFSDINNLNDPMEGDMDIYWDGDEILWKNFFRHYILCLGSLYFQGSISSKSDSLTKNDINILITDNVLTSDLYKNLYKSVYKRLIRNEEIIKVINVLSFWKVDKNTLLYYLESIHLIILDEIINRFTSFGLIVADHSNIANQVKIFIPNEQYDSTSILRIPEPIRINLVSSRLLLKHKLRSPNKNFNILMYMEFPMLYIERLLELVRPNAYMVCFSYTHRNSSMWGHYADDHKGICLIFDESLEFELKKFDESIIGIKKIDYFNKSIPVNFFEFIRIDECLAFWYIDGKKESKMYSKRLDPQWFTNFSNLYELVYTRKYSDWKDEREARGLLMDYSDKFKNKDTRKISYPRNLLKGIIFGVNTSEQDKIKILDILAKHREDLIPDFKVYQSYFDIEKNNKFIKRHEIRVESSTDKD